MLQRLLSFCNTDHVAGRHDDSDSTTKPAVKSAATIRRYAAGDIDTINSLSSQLDLVPTANHYDISDKPAASVHVNSSSDNFKDVQTVLHTEPKQSIHGYSDAMSRGYEVNTNRSNHTGTRRRRTIHTPITPTHRLASRLDSDNMYGLYNISS